MKGCVLVMCAALPGASCGTPPSGAQQSRSTDDVLQRDDVVDCSCYLPLLDPKRPRTVHRPAELAVLPLRFASAGDIADTLRTLVHHPQVPSSIEVDVDERSHSLLIHYENKEDLEQIEDLVARLDVELIQPEEGAAPRK